MSDIHDDHRWSDDDLDDTERVLAARLTMALAGRAGAVVVGDEAFDPGRTATIDLADGASPLPRPAAPPVRSASGSFDGTETEAEARALESLPIAAQGSAGRGWVVWAAAAVAAAVLVAAIVMTNSVHQPSVDVGGDPVPLVDPAAVWVPGWVPEGVELWSVTGGRNEGSSPPGRRISLQHLQSADGSLEIRIAYGADVGAQDLGTPITVRGQEGSTGSARSSLFDAEEIQWSEGAMSVVATVRGGSAADAVRVLDQLTVADPARPQDGFASLPADWTSRTGPYLGSGAHDPTTALNFSYDVGPMTGRSPPRVTVVTMSAGTNVYSYLDAAFTGTLGDDGVAVLYAPTVIDGSPTYTAVWPDGRVVLVYGSELIDETTARRIAMGVRQAALEDARALASDVSDRLGTAPVLVSGEVPSGRIEVVGAGEPTGICLTTAAGDRVCRPRQHGAGDLAEPLIGSTLVGSTWMAFAAGQVPLDLSYPPDAGVGPATPTTEGLSPTTTQHVPSTGRQDPSLQSEMAFDQGWTLLALAVPEDEPLVQVLVDGDTIHLPRPLI